jgi:excinuclease ABC subunit C
MEKFKFLKKDAFSRLPEMVGVYCFKGRRNILYIGKAVNIRTRVKNHFGQPNFRDNLFINQTEKVGYIKTDSEVEALLLEAKLIKVFQPKYNVLWRDDKNYFYVEITRDEVPAVSIVHQKKKKAEYIGPFVEGTALKKTLRLLRRSFPYYTARRHPKKECIWCHLKLCPGPNPNKKEYKKNIRKLIKVLKGESNTVLRELKREMKTASRNQEYEKAAKTRDQISHLETIISHARVLEPKIEPVEGPSQQILRKILNAKKPIRRVEAYDISNIQGKEATGSMVVFVNGKPDKSFYRKFKIRTQGKPNDTAMIKEVLKRRLKHKEWPLPDLVLIDGGKAQLNAAKSVVKKKTTSMALAKRNNELFVGNRKNPILLKSLPREISNLILHLRDEAHRFAISYHKKLRKQTLLEG